MIKSAKAANLKLIKEVSTRLSPVADVQPIKIAIKRLRKWTPEDVKNYRDYVNTIIGVYKAQNKRFTCEDLALSSLIDFAYQNNLRVTIINESSSSPFSNIDPKYYEAMPFRQDVLDTTAARHLYNTSFGNTVSGKTIDTAETGDLATTMSHIQVITKNEKDIMFIAQGNYSDPFSDSPNGDSDRLEYRNDAMHHHPLGIGFGYPGTIIQDGKFVKNTRMFYGGAHPENPRTISFDIRTWNFNAW